MEAAASVDFGDDVLGVLNASRTSKGLSELLNSSILSTSEVGSVYSKTILIAVEEAEGDVDAMKVKALESVSAMLTGETSESEAAILMSNRATHLEAVFSEDKSSLQIKVFNNYFDLSASGPVIDGDLVVQGSISNNNFGPALCTVDFTRTPAASDDVEGEAAVSENVVIVCPWQMIFQKAEDEHLEGNFTIPLRLPEEFQEGQARVRVYAGEVNDALTALYADESDEFSSTEHTAKILAGETDYFPALEFVAMATKGAAGGGSGDNLASGITVVEKSSQVIASVKLATDYDEVQTLRGEGYELCCQHLSDAVDSSDGSGGYKSQAGNLWVLEDEAIWPFFVLAKYGPTENGGVVSVDFISCPKSGPVEVEGEGKEGSELPPAVLEEEGVMTETFIQNDLAPSDATESVFLQVRVTLAPPEEGSDVVVYNKLTMMTAGLTLKEQEAAAPVEEGVMDLDEITIDGYLDSCRTAANTARSEAPTADIRMADKVFRFSPLPASLAAKIDFTAENCGLLLETANNSDAINADSAAALEALAADAGLDAEALEDLVKDDAFHEEKEGDEEGKGGSVEEGEEAMSRVSGDEELSQSDSGNDSGEDINEDDMAEELESRLADMLMEEQALSVTNDEMQKKVVLLMAREKAALQNNGASRPNTTAAEPAAPEGEEESATAATERAAEKMKIFAETLNGIVQARQKIDQQTQDYDQLSHDLQTRLDDREFNATEISESFGKFKSEILAKAENTRTSRPLSTKVIKQFEAAQAKRDEDLERVRLRNISMRTSLLRLERQLRSREQLAEGLHMIDFEQLKVENQTLYEKIEERTEELTKLNRKKTNTVQVLTHVREKLRFIEKSNVKLNQDLSVVENDTMGKRGSLTGSKKTRDLVRGDNKELRRKQGFASSAGLLEDFQKRTHDLGNARAALSELKSKFQMLSTATNRDNDLIASKTMGGNTGLPLMPGASNARSGGAGLGGYQGQGGQGQVQGGQMPQTPYFPGANPPQP